MCEIEIRQMALDIEAETAAGIMAASDPWMTLGLDFTACKMTIMRPEKDVFGAYMDGHLVGFVIVNMNGQFVGYVQSICVAEAWRGQGIGSHLMDFAEGFIFKRTRNVFLLVSAFNSGAQRFYKRRGYESIGKLPDYLVRGYTEILLRKTTGALVR